MSPPAAVRRLPSIAALSWDDCRLLVESVTDYAIFMLDADGYVATWNRGAERMKGYAPDEIIGEHFSRFFTPEEAAAGRPADELARALADGRVEDEGWRMRKDGTRFWANVVTTTLRDGAGNVRGFAKVTRDLTSRKNAETALRVSEERFHTLVDAVTDYAIFLLDAGGHIATWNAGARRTKGYETDEIIGKHFSVFYPPEDREAGRPEKILETVRREGRYEEEGWRVRKDGTRFWADVVITALRDAQGNVTGFAKVTRDLTERRASADELSRSEERFRLLVESVSDYAIYALDPNGVVATWNVGAQRLKGYAPHEIIGQPFSVFFTDEDRRAGLPEHELAVARETGRYEGEGWRLRKNGSMFWASVKVTLLRDPRGTIVGFAKITRDLTERREAEANEARLLRERVARAAAEDNERRLRASEEAARRAVQRAEEAGRMKDVFLATVSHELRTPLNAMMGYASLLRARASRETDPALAKAIEAIFRNAEAQARIVDDILDVSRIVTGKLQLDVRATDLVAVCKEAIEVVKNSAAAKQIAIELVAKCDPALLVADPERLRQVVWNLLSNAVKFTDRGGTITVVIDKESSKLLLSVRDTGRGIDPEFLPYVFERFKQADSSTTRTFGGLGLGLSIVRHIVELHGGQVSAESEGLGKGALFRVLLPVRAVVAPAADEGTEDHEPRAPARRARASLRGVRVVVVDDDEDARELVCMALAEAGADVEAADSASAGFELVRRFRPHVLVSDIGMPGEDGYALIERVRALDVTEGGGVPSIALTAYTRSDDRTKALAAGFTTHVGKPADPDDLVAAIANLAAFARR